MTQSELSEKTGFKQNTISNHENGKRQLDEQDIRIYSKALGVHPQELFDLSKSTTVIPVSEDARVLPVVDKRFTELSITYRKLRDEAKDKVVDYADNLLKQQENVASERLYSYKVYEKLSAGTGYSYLNDGNYDEVFYTGYFDHDFASWVFGDSMEPNYKSGDVVLIKQTGFDYDGAVYAVDWDGQTYIKKVYREDDGLRLVSINTQYTDKFAPYDENPRVIGKIVGNFKPVER